MRDIYWLRPRTLARYALALSLVLLIACGGTAPAAPDPAAPPAGAPPAAEQPAQAPAEPAPAAAQPQAPAAPVAEAAPTPSAPQTVVPTGTLSVGLKELSGFGAHPQLTVNPAMFVAGTALSEGLVTRDIDLATIPLLAESWSLSDDLTTWTFKIRQGVQFHKGYGEMTAEDVVWSFADGWAHNDKHTRYEPMRRVWMAEGGSVETPDDYTVVVNTGVTVPDVVVYDFLRNPGGSGTWVASKRQSDELGPEQANLEMAATGPWEIVEHRTQQYWRFNAVPDHWRQTPHFEELVLWEIPEESSRLAGFQTGHLDTFNMAFDSIQLVEAVPQARIMAVPWGGRSELRLYGGYYVGLGTPEQRPGHDPDLPWVSRDLDPASAEWERAKNVRLAMVMAVDAETLIDTLMHGYGRPAVLADWTGQEHLYDPDMKWEYDPDRARQLLAEAGYPGGGFSITLTPALRGSPSEVELCEAIGSMWINELNLDVRFQRIPYETLRPQGVARTYQGGWCHSGSIGLGPAASMVNKTTHGSTNAGVEHPWVEDIYNQIQATEHPAERERLEKEAGRWFFDNVIGNIAFVTWDNVWPVGPRIDERDWLHGIRFGDIRTLNGYEYIRHREQ